LISSVAKAFDQEQRLAFRLSQHVLQLAGTVERIDADQYRPDLRGRELRDDPLRGIGRPDADPVTRSDAKAQETPSSQLDLVPQFAKGVAQVLMAHDETIAIRITRGGIIEDLTDTRVP
jgi:hypothetical protein